MTTQLTKKAYSVWGDSSTTLTNNIKSTDIEIFLSLLRQCLSDEAQDRQTQPEQASPPFIWSQIDLQQVLPEKVYNFWPKKKKKNKKKAMVKTAVPFYIVQILIS